MKIDITKEEKLAISALERVAKRWPKTLWLFSGSGTLWVMKYKKDGTRAIGEFENMDSDYAISPIPIDNDGGDL